MWITLRLLAVALLGTLTNGVRAAEVSAAFPGAHGNYGGLLQVPDADAGPILGKGRPLPNGHLPTENPLNSGTLTVQLSDSGFFSAALNWQGYKYRFTGKFAAGSGAFAHTFTDLGIPKQFLDLSMTLNSNARTIDSALTSRSGAGPLFTAIGVLSGLAPDVASGLAFAGSLNASFIAPPDYGVLAQDIRGDGFSITRVSKTGGQSARIVGRLPDTEPFSAGSALRGTNYTIFSGLYRKGNRFGGLMIGQLTTANGSSIEPPFNPLTGLKTLSWAKRPDAISSYYPAGFETGFGIGTSPFQGAISPMAIPHISVTPGPVSATLALKDGNLGYDSGGNEIVYTAQIKIGLFGTKVVGPNPYRITLSTNAANATWTGSFIHPLSGKRTVFHGGFSEASGGTNGEGRGNFKGSLPPGFSGSPESGSARITVN